MVDRTYAVRPRIAPAGAVVDHRIVGPAVPQRFDHGHELLAAVVAVGVAHLALAAKIIRRRRKPRRDDVPAHTAIADVIQRCKLTREVERLGVGG